MPLLEERLKQARESKQVKKQATRQQTSINCSVEEQVDKQPHCTQRNPHNLVKTQMHTILTLRQALR